MPRRLAGFVALLAVVFVAAQGAALAHEIAHVLHLHDAPCALHLAADHLAMATAPEPAPKAVVVPSIRFGSLPLPVPPSPPARPSAARAPPLLP